MKSIGLYNCGFVIMPNHLHILLFKSGRDTDINKAISNSKRFLAYEIVGILKFRNRHNLLEQLAEGVSLAGRKKGKMHQVFKLSFDAKEVSGTSEIVRVLDFIHRNPVSGNWNLCSDYTEYPYSSAAYYDLGRESEFEVHHFEDVWQYEES